MRSLAAGVIGKPAFKGALRTATIIWLGKKRMATAHRRVSRKSANRPKRRRVQSPPKLR